MLEVWCFQGGVGAGTGAGVSVVWATRWTASAQSICLS